jgi:hypothetical protein
MGSRNDRAMPTIVLEGTVTKNRGSSSSANRQAPSIERLWNLRKGDQFIDAELIQSHDQWEVRFSSREHCFASHAPGSRELALQYARVIHKDFVADGWVNASA